MKGERLRRRLFLPGSQLILGQTLLSVNQMQHQELDVGILNHQASLKGDLGEIHSEGHVAVE